MIKGYRDLDQNDPQVKALMEIFGGYRDTADGIWLVLQGVRTRHTVILQHAILTFPKKIGFYSTLNDLKITMVLRLKKSLYPDSETLIVLSDLTYKVAKLKGLEDKISYDIVFNCTQNYSYDEDD